jgi:ATP-dependent DNA helicase RecG
MPQVNMGRLRIIHPEFEREEDSSALASHPIMPIYPLTAGLSQKDMRLWHEAALSAIASVAEYLPDSVMERARLCGVDYALKNIHFPDERAALSAAKYRLIFEELLLLRTGLMWMKRGRGEADGIGANGIRFSARPLPSVFERFLPFAMTEAQRRTIREIYADMESDAPMNRLVQGDVGSGKTAVAMAAIFKAVANGYQAVMMAPTEILAKQHYAELQSVFKTDSAGETGHSARRDAETAECSTHAHVQIQSDEAEGLLDAPADEEEGLSGAPADGAERQVHTHTDEAERSAHVHAKDAVKLPRVALLTSGVKGAEREAVLAALANGEIDAVVGTHALLQPDVSFARLGLVITDEQHRFGVNQRIGLSKKGQRPDILVMTATPIPRTLAFILYGDLDISVIDEMPPGRKRVITKLAGSAQRNDVYVFVRKQLARGRQAYVVAPLIEDNEEAFADVRSAEHLLGELKRRFSDCSAAMLHGGMKQDEKDRIMADYADGKIQILVSTVVIEVGVNVPNASVMIVENAERFGLAQLHQLRGRVGRGDAQSYCVLITDSDSKEATERAQILTETDDGFVIAEKDLTMRGPGELFGVRQHGIPSLRMADLVRHANILERVRDEATTLLERDPRLETPENAAFRRRIDRMFQEVADVGM